ncbi:SH3 domain-containing protein [Bartonella henselae]|uniref:SH3 domain-containing protein n=1 Tax=Bartonella henselae TaxID=38323 RepID=UPI0009E54DAA|nr:SH3 domain-containing protein [Bartonella henselae]UJM33392.1 SH3 domain-containing protein [Bartonella henselae]
MKKLVISFVFVSLFLTATVSGAANAFVTRNLNFRTGPSIQCTIHGLIPAGKLVFVQNCKANWCQIRYNTQTGWVSSRYLSFKDGSDLYETYTMLPITNHSKYSHSP